MMDLFQNFVIVFIGALNDFESLRKKRFQYNNFGFKNDS